MMVHSAVGGFDNVGNIGACKRYGFEVFIKYVLPKFSQIVL